MEIATAEQHEAIACNKQVDDYNEQNWPDFDELLWEEYFCRATEEQFNSELATYSCLQDLQGNSNGHPSLLHLGKSHCQSALGHSE